MSATEFFFDSNLLIYAYDQSEGEKQTKARRLLEQYFSGEVTLYFSTQVIEEFFVNVTQKIPKPLTATQAFEAMETLINYKPENVFTISPKQVLAAMMTKHTTSTPFWDCLLAETMKANGIHAILTEDTSDFSKISGIQAVNPFK